MVFDTEWCRREALMVGRELAGKARRKFGVRSCSLEPARRSVTSMLTSVLPHTKHNPTRAPSKLNNHSARNEESAPSSKANKDFSEYSHANYPPHT